MNRKFLISVVVLFIVSMVTDFIIHGALLGADYAKMAGTVFRTETDSQQYFPLMLLAHVLIACGFVWIYRQGHESGKPFMQQGLRFGAAVSLLATIPGYLIYYVVQPLPQALVVKQIVFSVIAALVMGVVVAWLHRD
jgi:hypothetical protein